MKYVIVRTTDGRNRGVVIEGTDTLDIVYKVSDFFQREYRLVADDGYELIVNDGHNLVVLRKKT